MPSACTAETVSGAVSHLGVISPGDTVAGRLHPFGHPAPECAELTVVAVGPAGRLSLSFLSTPVGRQLPTLPGPRWPRGACPSLPPADGQSPPLSEAVGLDTKHHRLCRAHLSAGRASATWPQAPGLLTCAPSSPGPSVTRLESRHSPSWWPVPAGLLPRDWRAMLAATGHSQPQPGRPGVAEVTERATDDRIHSLFFICRPSHLSSVDLLSLHPSSPPYSHLSSIIYYPIIYIPICF